jgi:hypothetical protein
VSSAEANVAADELTPEEVEALFAAQNGVIKTPANAITENDMDRLLRSLGDEQAASPWRPSLALEKKNSAKRQLYSDEDIFANVDDLHPREDSREDTLEEAVQMIRDLENAVATVDDTTIAIRDTLREFVEGVTAQLMDIEEGNSIVKAQNAAFTEEVRELRHVVVTMRSHIATLIRLVVSKKSGEPVLAPQE